MASFPGNPGMMPAAMNPNAGMSEQEQQMIKAVCDSSRSPTMFEMAAISIQHWWIYLKKLKTDNMNRCKWAWNHVSAKLSWPA
jgi:hypothetical protein